MRVPRKYQVRFVMAFAYCSDVKASNCEIAPLDAKGDVNWFQLLVESEYRCFVIYPEHHF